MLVVDEQFAEGAWTRIAERVVQDGWTSHRYRALLHGDGDSAAGSGSDLVHHLLLLHGDAPGLIEDARDATTPVLRPAWLVEAANAFAVERATLMRLASACGAVPSTPGQRDCEIAVGAQRHAITMLGRSDRQGCALGAALAFMLEWQAVRETLAIVALRVGLLLAPSALPRTPELRDQSTGFVRAVGFGSDQLLAQHRGLWSLLEARHRARH